ncbi:hypothetical protein [Streptomyces sp. NPDC059970]|uniref:ABC transporter ATP-binding protein n=1 Tax=Streptomyces sp. NPDC059970 TaxID=3347019 RepID=UPI0036C90013
MKDAQVVQEGAAEEVFDAPRHPYTKALLAAVVTIGTDAAPPGGAAGDGRAGPYASR